MNIGDATCKFTWEAQYHTATITVKARALQAIFIIHFPLLIDSAAVAVCVPLKYLKLQQFAYFEMRGRINHYKHCCKLI